MPTKTTAKPTKKTKKPRKLPTLYKVLDHECRSPHALYKWPLPEADGTPGAWVEVKEKLVQCRVGLHLTPKPERHYHDGCKIFEVEYDPEGIIAPEGDYEVVVRRARLVRRIPWVEMEKRWGILPKGRRPEPRSSFWASSVREPDPTSPGPKSRPGMSPALSLVSFVADEARRKRLSERRTRWAIREAVETAIKVRLDFAADDLATIQKKWGDFARIDEWTYSMAVKEKHETACRSYEKFANRKPILHDGKRLYIGASVWWAGRWFEVTRIDDAKGSITLGLYEYVKTQWSYSRRLVCQEKVAIDGLAKLRAENRAHEKREKRVKAIAEKLRETVTMPTVFKVSSWESYGRRRAEISDAQVFALPDAQVDEIAEWLAECEARRGYYYRDDMPPPPACVTPLIVAAERERAREAIQEVKYKRNDERGWSRQYVVDDAEITAFLAGQPWEHVLFPKEKPYVPSDKRAAKDPRLLALGTLLDGLKDPAWRPDVSALVRAYSYKLDSIDRDRREARRARAKARVTTEPVFCISAADITRSCT